MNDLTQGHLFKIYCNQRFNRSKNVLDVRCWLTGNQTKTRTKLEN